MSITRSFPVPEDVWDGRVRGAALAYPPSSSTAVVDLGTSDGLIEVQRSRIVGSGEYQITPAICFFDTSSLTADFEEGFAVTAVSLRIYVEDAQAADLLSLTAEWYEQPPITRTGYTDFPGNSALAGYPLANVIPQIGAEATIPLDNASGIKPCLTGLRLHISQMPGAVSPTGLNEITFADWSHPAEIPPTLVVTLQTGETLECPPPPRTDPPEDGSSNRLVFSPDPYNPRKAEPTFYRAAQASLAGHTRPLIRYRARLREYGPNRVEI